jgi:hypothetical protein
MSRSDWIEEKTAEALDAARVKARTQGREPTVAEFAAAINGVGAPPKRRLRLKREAHDERAWHFKWWLSSDDYQFERIKEAPGGFDPVYLASEMPKVYCDEEDCRAAIAKARERIPLIESVLAEVEKQKAAND